MTRQCFERESISIGLILTGRNAFCPDASLRSNPTLMSYLGKTRRWQELIPVLNRSRETTLPLSTELRNALESTLAIRQKDSVVTPNDYVLYNPETGKPYSTGDQNEQAGRKRLYTRLVALGIRAKVARVTAHCFRDTFACDMLARGASIFDVAKMLADTVDTVEKHYADFVIAARD